MSLFAFDPSDNSVTKDTVALADSPFTCANQAIKEAINQAVSGDSIFVKANTKTSGVAYTGVQAATSGDADKIDILTASTPDEESLVQISAGEYAGTYLVYNVVAGVSFEIRHALGGAASGTFDWWEYIDHDAIISGNTSGFANAGGGKVTVTCDTNHNRANGDNVTLTDADYAGTYEVSNAYADPTKFDIVATYSTGGAGGGTWVNAKKDLLGPWTTGDVQAPPPMGDPIHIDRDVTIYGEVNSDSMSVSHFRNLHIGGGFKPYLFLAHNQSNPTLQNLSITGGYAVLAFISAPGTVDSCQFRGVEGDSVITFLDERTVYTDVLSNDFSIAREMIIKNCIVDDSTEYGFYLAGGGITVENNAFTRCKGPSGVGGAESGAYSVALVTEFGPWTDQGIYTRNRKGCKIIGNSFDNQDGSSRYYVGVWLSSYSFNGNIEESGTLIADNTFNCDENVSYAIRYSIIRETELDVPTPRSELAEVVNNTFNGPTAKLVRSSLEHQPSCIGIDAGNEFPNTTRGGEVYNFSIVDNKFINIQPAGTPGGPAVIFRTSGLEGASISGVKFVGNDFSSSGWLPINDTDKQPPLVFLDSGVVNSEVQVEYPSIDANASPIKYIRDNGVGNRVIGDIRDPDTKAGVTYPGY
jgi:hypothetical protein